MQPLTKAQQTLVNSELKGPKKIFLNYKEPLLFNF
jgi:hypothetical protein